jgi:hypothetical protein
MTPAVMERVFRKFDADGDNQISRAELAAQESCPAAALPLQCCALSQNSICLIVHTP